MKMHQWSIIMLFINDNKRREEKIHHIFVFLQLQYKQFDQRMRIQSIRFLLQNFFIDSLSSIWLLGMQFYSYQDFAFNIQTCMWLVQSFEFCDFFCDSSPEGIWVIFRFLICFSLQMSLCLALLFLSTSQYFHCSWVFSNQIKQYFFLNK